MRICDKHKNVHVSFLFKVTLYGQSAGATHVLGLVASPLSKGLFHKAWMASGSPRYDKLAKDAYNDNLVYLKNTNCSTLGCLLTLSSQEATEAVPWDNFPNWDMYDQYEIPYRLTKFDGSMAIVDGKLYTGLHKKVRSSVSACTRVHACVRMFMHEYVRVCLLYSAKLLTFIKLPFAIKLFLSFYTGLL